MQAVAAACGGCRGLTEVSARPQEVPKSSAKAGRKAVPASFVEVIDTLLDHVLQHRPKAEAQQPDAQPAAGQGAREQASAEPGGTAGMPTSPSAAAPAAL